MINRRQIKQKINLDSLCHMTEETDLNCNIFLDYLFSYFKFLLGLSHFAVVAIAIILFPLLFCVCFF